MVSFSEALVAVKAGKAIQRSGWNGSGLVVKAQFPAMKDEKTEPCDTVVDYYNDKEFRKC